MDDTKLLAAAILYGKNALEWRRKFVGLLPEINRRRLYERKGCVSIFEFAAKFGGLSHDQVKLALNLEERFESLPVLHGLLVNGEVSVNKLARVVSIAKPENEESLAEAVQLLSKSAVETFVRDEKRNGLPKPEIEAKSLPGQSFTFNVEVTKKLMEMQEKGIDLNVAMMEMLNKREEEIEAEKNDPVKSTGRYRPVKIEKLLKREFGTKCSISSCFRPSKVIHHTQMFAMSKSHNPNYLAPLCKEHHAIAHAINLKVQEKRRC